MAGVFGRGKKASAGSPASRAGAPTEPQIWAGGSFQLCAHVGYREWRTALQAETDVMKWSDLRACTGAHVLTDRRTVTKRGQGPGGGQKRPPHGPAWEPAAGAPTGQKPERKGSPILRKRRGLSPTTREASAVPKTQGSFKCWKIRKKALEQGIEQVIQEAWKTTKEVSLKV